MAEDVTIGELAGVAVEEAAVVGECFWRVGEERLLFGPREDDEILLEPREQMTVCGWTVGE